MLHFTYAQRFTQDREGNMSPWLGGVGPISIRTWHLRGEASPTVADGRRRKCLEAAKEEQRSSQDLIR
jgi:hypothetical protein